MRRKEATEWKNKSKGVKKKEKKRVEKIGSGVRLAYKINTVRMALLGRGIHICHKAFFLRFIYWLWWVFIVVHGLSLVAASGAYSLVTCSHCSGFSCGAQALGTWASVVAASRLCSCGSWTVECSLSSCGARALLFPGMWNPPRPGIEPRSSALAGGFLPGVPPGKSPVFT